MQAYHSFFSPWEKETRSTHPDIVTELGDFRFHKTDWLEEDLATLGAPAGSAISSVIPVHVPRDLAGLAGCLYGVEGSTLGGYYMIRSGKTFPAGADRFYRGYSEKTPAAWQSFIDWLEDVLDTEEKRSRAAQTACETFHWFETEFASSGRGSI